MKAYTQLTAQGHLRAFHKFKSHTLNTYELDVMKACYARLYSYSRFKKREALIALGSHQRSS